MVCGINNLEASARGQKTRACNKKSIVYEVINMPESYYLSDEAYELLCNVAVQNGFMRPGAIRKAGISRFLNKLAYFNLNDTRPEEIRESDEEYIAARRVPVWRPNIPRRIRILDLSEAAIEQYVTHAIKFRIVMQRPYIGGPSWRSFNAIVAATLEAIGSGWLTPENNEWPADIDGPKEARKLATKVLMG